MQRVNPPTIILPDGRTAYYNPYTSTYTVNRAYAFRMQRGFARGLPQYEARGQRLGEYQRRREVLQEQEGITPWQRTNLVFQARHGYSYSYWQKLRRTYVNEINSRSAPGAKILVSHIDSVKQQWDTGWRDQRRPEIQTWQEWVETHLAERLEAIIAYQDDDDNTIGAANFAMRSYVPPIEFWYYH